MRFLKSLILALVAIQLSAQKYPSATSADDRKAGYEQRQSLMATSLVKNVLLPKPLALRSCPDGW